MQKAQEEDTTKCSQHGNNCIQLLLVINVEGLCKNNAQLNGMEMMFSLWNGKPKCLQYKVNAMSFVLQTAS
jgi:hypothetical protein